MSRSQRAWAKGCELVGAAVCGARRLGKHEVLRERLETERPARTAPSIPTLTWVATAVILIAALEPAVALGWSASRGGRAPVARAAQVGSPTSVANTERGSDPSGSSGPVARGQTVLAFGSGYGDPHGSQAVRGLQRGLANLGYAAGPIDGRYGPLTERAVIRFQTGRHLHVDGIAGPQTLAALAVAKIVLFPGAGYVPGGSGPVRALQRHLTAVGFSPGPIDGRYGPLTERAVIRFQTVRHLHVDGIAGPQTLGRLERAGQRPAPHRPTTRTAPSGAHRQPRPPRAHPRPVPSHQTAHRAKHPAGPSPIPWIVVFACLILATLAALLWHGRRHREVPPPAVAPEPVPDEPGAGLAEESRELHRDPLPDLVGEEFRDVPRDPHPGAGAFLFGRLFAADGDLAAARDSFWRAHERGHPEAAFELGMLMAQQGDWSGAEQAFRAGDERGHAGATFNLGALLLNRGDPAGAEAVFARADERGDLGAACNHGVLLEDRGDLTGAKLAYLRAEERGEVAGAFNLGQLLEQEGDREGAKAAYRRADRRGDAGAAYHLGRLLEQEGDREGAKAAYERADGRAGELGPPEVAELAHAALRDLGVEERPDR